MDELTAQIHNLQQENLRLRADNRALQDERMALLASRLQSLQREPDRASHTEQGSGLDEQRIDAKASIKAAEQQGFTVLDGNDPYYRDPDDKAGSTMLMSANPSKPKEWPRTTVQPVVLRDIPWKLTRVEMPQQEANGNTQDALHESTSPQENPLKRHHRQTNDDLTDNFNENDAVQAKRRRATEPNTDHLEHRNQPPPHPYPHHRQKSVCTHCWLTRSLCDFGARCETCRSAGAKCIRKSCPLGNQCTSIRCPCIHPNQWDPKNPEWNVEDGQMPRRDVRPVSSF